MPTAYTLVAILNLDETTGWAAIQISQLQDETVRNIYIDDLMMETTEIISSVVA